MKNPHAQALGALGGKSKSEAKSKASKENGKKGGRPKVCKKCDDQGMITEVKNGAHYGHSCDCGKYHRLMNARWDNVNIADLLSYGARRIQEKGGK